MSDKHSGPRIIVALDYPGEEAASAFLDSITPELCRVKVGKELFTRAGPNFVRRLVERGFEVFLDLKFHDIPNTVASACEAAADLGVWMLNVHALGGRNMLNAARTVLERMRPRPFLIGVTVLTSLETADLEEIGLQGNLATCVRRLAKLSYGCELDGIVCSPQEAQFLREYLGDEFILVTPGVRPQNAAPGDQKRIMTPIQALRAGADYLVIGRPVTRAPDPKASLVQIHEEIAQWT